jgi:prepilin-type N-terminal cleavage/methylation domain-containing protein
VSRTSKGLRWRKRGDESGFTLIEVMAAMIVFAIVATGVTAMFASGLRASLLTKMDTTAKNLSQQMFESIRNLPFHIDQVSTGNNPPDLLDTYYTTSTGSVGRGAHGFVPNGAARWTEDGDPATGAFYRHVLTQVPGFPKFKQYVATQFLNDNGQPHNPTGFNALTPGSDTPPTITVGVGVTTLWTAGELSRVSRTYSEVTSGTPTSPYALLQSRMAALRLTGGTVGGSTVTMELAALTSDGSLSQTVSAAQSVKGATMALSTAASVSGAVATAKAPPNAGPLANGAGSRSLVVNGFTYGTVGTTLVSSVSASSSTGQVVLGTSTTPARGDILGAGNGTRTATFAIDGTTDPRLDLRDTHVVVEDAGCGGGCSNLSVSGWANTTKGTSSFSTNTSATGVVRSPVALLRTNFAPSGLIRVQLTSASISCTVTRSGGGSPVASATLSYTGRVSYWAPYAPSQVGGYVTVNVSSADTASPLSADILANTQVGNDSTGNPLWLSDYVQRWSSVDATSANAGTTVASDGTTVTSSVSGVIGLTSQPLRSGDDSSIIGADFGVGSCTAEEYR